MHRGIKFHCIVLLSLSIGLISVSAASAQTVKEFNEVVSAMAEKSPAGGPKGNPDAAVFVAYRKSKKLCWVAGGKVVSVGIVSSELTDDTKIDGPTPVGEYLIGKRITHDDYKIDWYRLYPQIEDNSGYYGYTTKTKSGRNGMGLHPGKTSKGCITVKSADTPYDKAEVWKQVRDKLDGSKLTYKKDDFLGFLFVVDK